jgi:hypothetical protein
MNLDNLSDLYVGGYHVTLTGYTENLFNIENIENI